MKIRTFITFAIGSVDQSYQKIYKSRYKPHQLVLWCLESHKRIQNMTNLVMIDIWIMEPYDSGKFDFEREHDTFKEFKKMGTIDIGR